MKKLLILVIALISLNLVSVRAEVVSIDLDKVIYLESKGDPLAVGKYCGGRGLFQITVICLKDYNKYHKIDYAINDLFNPIANREVAVWYLLRRIPQLLRASGKAVTLENILIAYKDGYRRVGKPLKRSTKKYIRDYKRTK